jgi:general secretion pathway protein L
MSTQLSEHVSPNILPSQVVGARDKEVWAVVPASALSWHCITLPSGLHKQKTRLLPVLQALLEEQVLEEPENLHIALQPDWQAGSQVWVATCEKAWLKAHLNQLQSMGHHVHRIVPEWTPTSLTANESLKAWVSGVPEDAWLWVSHSQGAWRLPLQAGIQWWAEKLNTVAEQETHDPQAFKGLIVQAEPAVANLAQKALQTLQALVAAPMAENLESWRVVATPATERIVQAADTAWDLAQFDFAAHGSARWRQSFQRAWQQFAHETAWRPVRWSLAGLIAVQWLGLNAVAWQLNDKVKAQREQQRTILTQTFPNVPVVDASLQMSRELERLQRQVGSLNAKDLESMLQTIGTALPTGQSINSLDFQAQGTSEIRLQGLQLSNEQQAQFVSTLRSKGYEAQVNSSQWRIVTSTSKQGGA